MGEVSVTDILRSNGLKKTRQREAVMRVLTQAPTPVSADNVYQSLLGDDETISLSTVYRILELFLQKGVVEQDYHPVNGKHTFTLASRGHIHLLTCTLCGNSERMDRCPLASMHDALEIDHSFQITGHKLEVFGLCRTCRTRENKLPDVRNS